MFDPIQFGYPTDIEAVFLHLSVEEYKADLMLKDADNPNVLSVTRMLPPGRLRYYYSVGEDEK